MRRFLNAVGLALALVAANGVAPVGASTSVADASNRCNGQTIDDQSARVRDYDRRGSGGNNSQLLARLGGIADVIAVINEEREILDSVCSSDAQRAALFAQIAATTAWALTLEADIAAKLNASCPAAAQALPTVMLADAWLSLANVINSGGGAVPPAFATVVPKVQTRAQAVGLALPTWADTSAYWRDQIRLKAKAAVATCPSPTPPPSP